MSLPGRLRARNPTVSHNEATGNCVAVLVAGDGSKSAAGELRVTHDHLHADNKHCAATPRRPFLQGTGIVLTGADDTPRTVDDLVRAVKTQPHSLRCIALWCSEPRAWNVRPLLDEAVRPGGNVFEDVHGREFFDHPGDVSSVVDIGGGRATSRTGGPPPRQERPGVGRRQHPPGPGGHPRGRAARSAPSTPSSAPPPADPHRAGRVQPRGRRLRDMRGTGGLGVVPAGAQEPAPRSQW
ncbi:hypothetical protein [Streptomyces sp. NPDC058625]|uniref:hypothetical protein n=1 Tax=Streptomyces sp. NPDC058625 TaxID=3346564 RepID=UPI00364E7658